MAESEHTWLGAILWIAGRLPEAIARLRQAVDLDRSSWHAHYHLGVAFRLSSRLQEAIDELETAVRLTGRHPWPLAELGLTHQASGNTARALAIHDELVARSRVEFAAPALLAALSGALGKTDQAFEFLGRAYEVLDTWCLLLWKPHFDPLRADPRFQALLQKMNFPAAKAD